MLSFQTYVPEFFSHKTFNVLSKKWKTRYCRHLWLHDMAQCGHTIIYLTIPMTTDVQVVSIYLPLKLILKVHLPHTCLCKSRMLDEELLRQRYGHFDGPCWYCHESAEFMRHFGALHNLGGNIYFSQPPLLCLFEHARGLMNEHTRVKFVHWTGNMICIFSPFLGSSQSTDRPSWEGHVFL